MLGGVDPNILGLGTAEQVRAEVRRLIRELAPGGGYAVGASPCFPLNAPMENIEALRRTTFECGVYPIGS